MKHYINSKQNHYQPLPTLTQFPPLKLSIIEPPPPHAMIAICENKPPLIDAILDRNTEVVISLIKQGEDVNCVDSSGQTPLRLAIMEGKTEVAISLIEHGADVNCVDSSGQTPLELAIMFDRTEVAISLIEHGANVNFINYIKETPLELAIMKGKTEVAISLIEHDANVHFVDCMRRTPLQNAIMKGKTEVAKLLMENGAKLPENQDGEIEEKYITSPVIFETMFEIRENFNNLYGAWKKSPDVICEIIAFEFLNVANKKMVDKYFKQAKKHFGEEVFLKKEKTEREKMESRRPSPSPLSINKSKEEKQL